MIFEDGSEYEGEWINGLKQGKGIERTGNGNDVKIFKGIFESNNKVGPDWNIVFE